MSEPHISIEDFFGALQETDGFTDEFGVISPEVYQAAGELWQQAAGFVHSRLHDTPTGMRLMLKAAATVSRKRREQPDQIRDLKAYLWTTFKHFISDEVEKENRNQPLEPEQWPVNYARDFSEVLSDQIPIEEVLAQMDSWTRKVFELLTLGRSFEEIAQMLKMRPNLLRSKFHKEIKKLSRRLDNSGSEDLNEIDAMLTSMERQIDDAIQQIGQSRKEMEESCARTQVVKEATERILASIGK